MSHPNPALRTGRLTKTEPTRSKRLADAEIFSKENLVGLLFALMVANLSIPTRSVDVFIFAVVILSLLFVRGISLDSLSSIVPMLICIFFYGMGFMVSGGEISLPIIQDAPAIALSLVAVFMIGRISIDGAKLMLLRYSKTLVVFTVLTGVLSIVKFVLWLNGIQLEFVQWESGGQLTYSPGTALVNDYNFYTLGMVSGLIAAVWLLYHAHAKGWMRAVALLAIPISIFCILFANSRRGWSVLILLLIVSIGFFISEVLSRHGKGSMHADKSRHSREYRNGPLGGALIFGSVVVGAIILVWVVPASSGLTLTEIGEMRNLQSMLDRFGSITGETGTFAQSFAARSDMWDYGVSEIIANYSVLQLLIGDGFHYLRQYAQAFPSVGGNLLYAEHLYPHNPLLSAFHYSGLAGFIAVLMLMVAVLVKTIELRKQLGNYLLVLFVVMLIYCLPSGNSIFAFRSLALFMIIVLEIDSRFFRLDMPRA